MMNNLLLCFGDDHTQLGIHISLLNPIKQRITEIVLHIITLAPTWFKKEKTKREKKHVSEIVLVLTVSSLLRKYTSLSLTASMQGSTC